MIWWIIAGWLVFTAITYRLAFLRELYEGNDWTIGDRKRFIVMSLFTWPLGLIVLIGYFVSLWLEFDDFREAKW